MDTKSTIAAKRRLIRDLRAHRKVMNRLVKDAWVLQNQAERADDIFRLQKAANKLRVIQEARYELETVIDLLRGKIMVS